MSNCRLVKNMLLYCRDGQTVILDNYSREFIWVRYKGKIHRRPIEAINQTLFLTDPTNHEIPTRKDETCILESLSRKVKESSTNPQKTSSIVSANEEIEKTCMTCRFQRSGECFPSQVCDDYEPVYNTPKDEKDAWPQYGDATMLGRRKHRKPGVYR